MQSSRVVAGILAALVAMPATFTGHLLRTGNTELALRLAPAIMIVVLISAAIMSARKPS
jgi:hypothetical protein